MNSDTAFHLVAAAAWLFALISFWVDKTWAFSPIGRISVSFSIGVVAFESLRMAFQ